MLTSCSLILGAGQWSVLNVYSSVLALALNELGLVRSLEIVAESQCAELATQVLP